MFSSFCRFGVSVDFCRRASAKRGGVSMLRSQVLMDLVSKRPCQRCAPKTRRVGKVVALASEHASGAAFVA